MASDARRGRAEFVFEDDRPFAECHASTLAALPDGRLLCAWFGGTKESAPDVAIWASVRSQSSWCAPKVAADDPELPHWNPALFMMPGGELLLFYKVGPNPRDWWGRMVRSADSGETWSAPEDLPQGILGPIKNKPLLMSNGELLCPSSTETLEEWTCWAEVSPDAGRTWQRFGPIAVPGEKMGLIQPTFWETEAGHVHALIRATKKIGRICRAHSLDYGRTWSEAYPADLSNPNSGIDAARLPDGRIALVYNPTLNARTPLSLALSSDNGLTWSWHVDLETEPGEYSYPAIIVTSDGLAISYTWKRERVRFWHFRYDEIGK